MTQMTDQMRRRDTEMVPRVLVQAMFTLMGVSLLLVSLAVLTDRPRVGTREAAPVAAEVTLTLAGDRDGVVTARGMDGAVLAVSDGDRNGFIGVIWRVLARERRLQGADEGAPVRVVRRTDGQIAVLDEATGTAIELVGYGPDNVAAFARLVPGAN